MKYEKYDINFYDYEIIIKKKNNKYFGYISELSLYSVAKNSNLVLEDLEKKFNELLNHYEKSGSIHLIKTAKKHKKDQFFKNELLSFSIKLIIIGFIFLTFILLSGTFLANKFQQISIIDILASETKKISSLVYKKIDENKNDKESIENFKKILLTIKPFVTSFEEVLNK